MELAYNDEKTPKEYEPPGFQPSRPKLRGDAEEVGEVETRFHRLGLLKCVRASLNKGLSLVRP